MGEEMHLSGHLGELRSRLMRVLLPFVLLCGLGVAASGSILEWVFAPLQQLRLPLYLYHLADALWLRLRAGVLAALVLAAPWLGWQLYHFARPGLHACEARALRRVCLAFGGGFGLGAVLCFCFAAPGLVAWFCRGRPDLLLSAERYFTAWEAACLLLGLLGGMVLALPLAIGPLRRWRKKSRNKGQAGTPAGAEASAE